MGPIAGLGVLGCTSMSPDEMRTVIRRGGLAIVKAILERHHGSIAVDGTAGGSARAAS